MIDQILQNGAGNIEIDVFFNNTLTDPTSITINYIRDPNGVLILTDVTPVSGDGTGRYYYTVGSAYTALLGIYQAEWQFVISGVTFKHLQEFEVVSTIRTGYVVPSEVRDMGTYSGITATEPNDTTLQKYIDKTTVIMDAYFGSSINYAVYSEEVRCVIDKVHNGVHIQLRHRPIISLTSVTLTSIPANTVSLDVDTIRINNNAGYLEYFYDVSYPTLKVCVLDPSATSIVPVATVAYTAGYCVIPDAVKQAAVIITEELYKQSMGDDKQLAAFKIGDQSETYRTSEAMAKALSEFGLEGAVGAMRLLRGYRQPMRSVGIFGPLG